MPVLNEDLVFNHAPRGVRSAFVNSSARRHRFDAGWELFKFTGYRVFSPDNKGRIAPISPWWCSVHPVPSTIIPGLDQLLQEASRLGLTPLDYAREFLAVQHGWNSLADVQLGLARIQKLRLLQPVYGFYGLVNPQVNDRLRLKKPARRGESSLFRGGAIQIWIPNLTTEYAIPTGIHFV